MKRVAKYLCATIVSTLLLVSCHHTAEQFFEVPFDFIGTCWTDGYEFYVGSTDTITQCDSLILFQGGNLHEGGMGFALRVIAPETYVIEPLPGADWTAMGVPGDTVILHLIDEQVMMLFYCPDNIEPDTLRLFDPGNKPPRQAYAEMLHRKRVESIKGQYVDTETGTRYHITDSLYITIDARGNTDTMRYEIFYEFDMPSHTLILSNGKKVWYEISDKGLDFFAAKYYRKEDAYDRGDLLCQTERL